METKKNIRYDLERKRPLFFAIGMIISLSLTILAFEWRSEIEPIVHPPEPEEPVFTIHMEDPIITRMKVPMPPKPQPQQVVLDAVVIEEAKEALESLEPLDDFTIDVEEEVGEMAPFVEEEAEEAPLNFASNMPTFAGGMDAFYTFLAREMRYPRKAQNIGIEGRVHVRFIVEKDGSLSNIEVIKGIGAGCDEEALRVMSLVPRFVPGKQGDRTVRVQMTIPVNFVLH